MSGQCAALGEGAHNYIPFPQSALLTSSPHCTSQLPPKHKQIRSTQPGQMETADDPPYKSLLPTEPSPLSECLLQLKSHIATVVRSNPTPKDIDVVYLVPHRSVQINASIGNVSTNFHWTNVSPVSLPVATRLHSLEEERRVRVTIRPQFSAFQEVS